MFPLPLKREKHSIRDTEVIHISSQIPHDPNYQALPKAESYEREPEIPDEPPTSPPVNISPPLSHSVSSSTPRNDVSADQVIAGLVIAGLVLGIISMFAWLIPVLGLVVALLGIVFSALGRRFIVRRGMATAGLVLSIIGLALALGLFGDILAFFTFIRHFRP